MNAPRPPKPSSPAQAPGMSGEDMLKVFELLKGATSVELKLDDTNTRVRSLEDTTSEIKELLIQALGR